MLNWPEFERACRESRRTGWWFIATLCIWVSCPWLLMLTSVVRGQSAAAQSDDWDVAFAIIIGTFAFVLPASLILSIHSLRRAARDRRIWCPNCSTPLIWDRSYVLRAGKCRYCKKVVHRLEPGVRLWKRLRFRALVEAWPHRRPLLGLFIVVLILWVGGSLLFLTGVVRPPFPGFLLLGMAAVLVLAGLVWRMSSLPSVRCVGCGTVIGPNSLTANGDCIACGRRLIAPTGVARKESRG